MAVKKLINIHTVGRRKTAIARIYLQPGEGNITVNGRKLSEYFRRETLEMIIKQPLVSTKTLTKYDIKCNWKLLIDNFVEYYHLPAVHPRLVKNSVYLLPNVFIGTYYASKQLALAKKYENFIINIDSEGNPVEHTCNPTLLSLREYLTPVFFQREVLKKYYDNPHKYTVGDNYLSCGSLWGMRYGQNPSGLVHAWLGDLGEYLPHTEQLHWKQYNVPPEGGLGPATIKRELMAIPSEPDETTHKFKYDFKEFSEIWTKKFGWHLFLPLENEDKHFMKSLHVPVSENPLEFDQQILALAKILPDSINVSEIKKTIKVDDEEIKNSFGIKGNIAWLEALLVFFFKENDETAHKITKPIRIIQKLRSASAAHRKGRKYDKISRKLGLDRCSRIEYFKNLLEDVIKTLKKLQEYCESR